MFENLRRARKNARRLAARLLSVMAIMLVMASPVWSDTEGTLSFSSTTSDDWGFSADICVTTLAANLGISTTNAAAIQYTIPTPTATIDLGVINPYTFSSITLNPQVQFDTAPTFSVTDNINFNTSLNLSGFGASIGIDLPNLSYNGISITTNNQGDSPIALTASTSGATGTGSGTQTLSQTGNSGTLWSIDANLITLAKNLPAPVGTAAAVLDAAGVYFKPTAGISLIGNYSLALNTSLAPITNLTLGGESGSHSLSISDPLTISLAAAATYLYDGKFYIKYGDKISLGLFTWDAIGPNTLGSLDLVTWAPTASTASASAQLSLADFMVTVLYTIPDSWDNPNGSSLYIVGNRDNFIPLNNAGYIYVTNTNNPGTLNNANILNNAYKLYIESGGTLNNNAGGTLNNNAGGYLDVAGTLNNNSGSTLNNNCGLYAHDISSGGTLNNNAGALLINNASGTLSFSRSALDNSGTLTSAGAINLDNGSGMGINAGGSLTNSGTINNKNDSGLYNYGTFDNSGNVYNEGGTQTGVWNYSGGTLNNHGVLTNYDSGCQIANYGLLNNFWDINIGPGTLYNALDGILNNSGYIGNIGILNNTNNATLNNSNLLQSNGVINNSATLNNTASGKLINNYGTINNNAGGVLNNYGTMNNQATSTLTNNAGATLNNDGTLSNKDHSYIENYGTLNNNASRLLTNDATSYLIMYAGGILNNSGFLVNSGALTVGIWGEAGGTLNNNAGGTLSNSGTLYNYTGALNNSGTLLSSGEILGDGTYTQTAGYTVNSNKMEQAAVTIDGGAYYLSSTGSLTVRGPLKIGDSGTATFVQEGGSNAVTYPRGTYESQEITLGGSSGASGTYYLQGGSLSSTSLLDIGDYGTGTFTQTGSYNQASYEIILGAHSGGSGTYTLTDGGVVAATLFVGLRGTGSFVQTGDSGQTGGYVTMSNAVNIGSSVISETDPIGIGTYTLDKGTLRARDLTVGMTGSGDVTGTLNITSATA